MQLMDLNSRRLTPMKGCVMLVLSRKKGQRLHLGEGIVLTVLALNGGQVRLGIEAPEDVRILREEIQDEWPASQCKGEAAKPVR